MVIGEIQKSKTQKIIVSKGEFRGREFIDLRIYYQAEKEEYKPTKRGIAIPPDKLEEIIKLLSDAKNAVLSEDETSNE